MADPIPIISNIVFNSNSSLKPVANSHHPSTVGNQIGHIAMPESGNIQAASKTLTLVQPVVHEQQPGGTVNLQALQSAAIDSLLTKLDSLGPEAFHAAMARIYGDAYDAERMDALVAQLRSSDAGALAMDVKLVGADVLGQHAGAFARNDTGQATVYLNDALLNRSPTQTQQVFTEEWLGHGLAALVTRSAATQAGDEGEALARWLGGEHLQSVLKETSIDFDHGLIFVDGALVRVRFHTSTMNSRWETKREYVQEDWMPAARDRLEAMVGTRMIEMHRGKELADGTPVASLAQVEAYLAEQGREYSQVWNRAMRDVAGNGEEPALAQQLAREAVGAAVLARFKLAKLVDEETTLDSDLPTAVRAVMIHDRRLAGASPRIGCWRDLLDAITGDADGDGRRDFDTLKLAPLLRLTQQRLLIALSAPLSNSELGKALESVGFEATMNRDAASHLKLVAPVGFGLAGKTLVDKVQQQLALRIGGVFCDVDDDKEVDDSDTVSVIDEKGAIREIKYGDFDVRIKKMVRLNLAIAGAVKEYNAASGSMSFVNYTPSTRTSKKETVNKEYWRIEDRGRGQVAWILQPGKLPSDAVSDPIVVNPNKYTTECAQGRTMMLLHGMRRYYEKEFPDGEGLFRLNRIFAKDKKNAEAAEKHLGAWIAFKKTAPDKTWKDFEETNPPPALELALKVSRHMILNGKDQVVQPYHMVQLESAAGTQGYFHNRAVSPIGVKRGYIGENVIDLGYENGVRRFWGHPSGIKTESSWQSFLGKSSISIHHLSDYREYFEISDNQHNMGKMAERMTKPLDDAITATEKTVKPLEKQMAERDAKAKETGQRLEASRAELRKLDEGLDSTSEAQSAKRSQLLEAITKAEAEKKVLEGSSKELASQIEPLRAELEKMHKTKKLVGIEVSVHQAAMSLERTKEKLAAATSWLKGYAGHNGTKAMKPFVEALTVGAQRQLTQAFIELPPDIAVKVAKEHGAQKPEALSDIDKACCVSRLYLLPDGHQRRELGRQLGAYIATASINQWFDTHLTSQTAFEEWLQSEKFQTWYQGKTDKPFAGKTKIDEMKTAEIQHIIELAIPATKHMRTAYSNMQFHSYVSQQMAVLIKDGKLAPAELEGHHVLIPIE
ncbi:hypothetical protein ACFL6C_06605 [Myxococcota bacterium]